MNLCCDYLQNEYGAELASSLSSPFYYRQVEYTDKKGKKNTKIDPSSAQVLYAKLIYSEKSKKILSLFKTKGRKDFYPFKYIDQYCKVRMAFIKYYFYPPKYSFIKSLLSLSKWGLCITSRTLVPFCRCSR